MPTTFNVHSEPKSVAASELDPATIYVHPESSVFYKNTDDVNINDTEIESGKPIEVEAPVWLVSEKTAKVTVLRNADRVESDFRAFKAQTRKPKNRSEAKTVSKTEIAKKSEKSEKSDESKKPAQKKSSSSKAKK